MMPDRHDIALEKEERMTDVHIFAIDLAKRSFQACATAPGGAQVTTVSAKPISHWYCLRD